MNVINCSCNLISVCVGMCVSDPTCYITRPYYNLPLHLIFFWKNHSTKFSNQHERVRFIHCNYEEKYSIGFILVMERDQKAINSVYSNYPCRSFLWPRKQTWFLKVGYQKQLQVENTIYRNWKVSGKTFQNMKQGREINVKIYAHVHD